MAKPNSNQTVIVLLAALAGMAAMLLVSQASSLFGGGELYVSDLGEINVIEYEWKEPKLDTSIDGNNLLIGDKFYEKGIGVHAISEVSVTVPAGYRYFVSDVGVDDEIAPENPASVQFIVLADGVVLYESPVLKADSPPYRVRVRVDGHQTLNLRATGAGDGTNSDHADWGGARFTKN